MESFLQKNLFQIMNIWFWVQTWVDVDFLAVGKLTKTTFPMAYEAKKGRLTFSFYVIKRFTQIFVKVNQKMKNERVLKSYIIFFTTSYHLRLVLHLLQSHSSCMKGVLNFFFKIVYENFIVGTLETVRDREESVLERCPYREVRLYSFIPQIIMWKVWIQESFQK